MCRRWLGRLPPPKFQWTIHLVLELQRFAFLLSCWVHERKHAMVLRYLRDIRNTSKYETSILSETTCHHMSALSEPWKFDRHVGLVPPIVRCKERMVAFYRMNSDPNITSLSMLGNVAFHNLKCALKVTSS